MSKQKQGFFEFPKIEIQKPKPENKIKEMHKRLRERKERIAYHKQMCKLDEEEQKLGIQPLHKKILQKVKNYANKK